MQWRSGNEEQTVAPPNECKKCEWGLVFKFVVVRRLTSAVQVVNRMREDGTEVNTFVCSEDMQPTCIHGRRVYISF